MAFEFAQATTVQDLFNKLSTFAVANGWTQDHAASGRLFLSKSTVFVSFRWDTATPANVGIYQALAFAGSGTDPGNHTNDSGQGIVTGTNATLATGRSVALVNSSMNYWFFEEDTYIHVVVETTVGSAAFRHFGFGIGTKFGTWTGGEYSYGQKQSTTAGTGTLAVRSDATNLLDGLASGVAMTPFVASVHVEGLPSQAGTSKWGLVWDGGIPSTNDRAGNGRVWLPGGFRAGTTTGPLARFSGTALQMLLPLTPLNTFYSPNSTTVYPLLTMPDVRAVNIKDYAGGQEIVVGSDTWVVFPSRQKDATTGGVGSQNQGIAYKKIP